MISGRNRRIINAIQNQEACYETLNDLFGMARAVYEEDNQELPYSLKLTKYVKDIVVYLSAEEQLNELYWNVLHWEAPHLFDSYLLYLEKKREEKDKFYEPKREQLNKHGLIQALQDMEDDKLDILSISMPPGTQKCQPLYAKVLTPNGYIDMKDVHSGTKVIAGNGKIATVLSESSNKG